MTVCLTVTLNGAVLARQELSLRRRYSCLSFCQAQGQVHHRPISGYSNSYYSVLFKYKRPGPTKPTNSTSVNCQFNSLELDTTRVDGLVLLKSELFSGIDSLLLIHFNSIKFKRPKHSNTIQSKILKGRHEKVLFAVLPGFYFERPKTILYLYV